MSVATVARNDFRSIRRSYVVVGVVATFTAIVGLVFTGSGQVHTDPYRTLWGFSALVVWVLPLFLAPLSYLAVAGDRARGTVVYHLGLPNSRAGYFAAKYAVRAGVTVATVVLGVAVAVVVAALTYEQAPDPARFLTFGAISTLYALAIVGVFLAVSAWTATRSRAMFGVLGAYFVLAAFWSGFVPMLNLATVLDAVASLPGVSIPDSARALVGALSPSGAYFNLLPELIWPDVASEYDVFRQFQGLPDYLGYEPWVNVLSLLGWTVGAPLAGYLGLRRAELG